MKKHYLFFLVFLYVNNVLGQWTQKASVGGGIRYGGAGFSIGTKGYIGFGYNGNLMSDFWEYDPASGTWTQKADFGITLMSPATFAIGNKGYVGLGTSSYPGYNFITDFWEYDPAVNTWTQKGNFPGHGRYTPATFTIGLKGYMGTGWDGSYYNDFWEYDPSNDTWTQKANFATARQSATGFAFNNKGYIATGYDWAPENDLWEYDPSLDTWTSKATFPGTARYAPVSFALCNYVYLGLGSVTYPSSMEVKDFWRYDPSADSWIQIADFNGAARRAALDFVINDTAFVGTGGAATTWMNDFWAFSVCAALPPVASFQASDTVICANDCINYTDYSNNATSWQWSFAGGIPSSSTDQNPYVCYQSAGIYDVKLVVSNSGGTDSVTISNYINVKPVPLTPLITQAGTTLYCATDSTYISYQWFDSTKLIPGATDTSLVINHSGNYNVKVTNANGCSIAVGINIVLGLRNYISDDLISLFPNPAADQLTIYSPLNKEAVIVSIINLTGQIIQEEKLKWKSDSNIYVKELPSGIYFLQLRSESGCVTKQFVKE